MAAATQAQVISERATSNYEDRHKAIVARAQWLLSARTPLLSYWQDIAENFYAVRSDFTITRYIGDEFAYNQTTSYPSLVMRDLQDQIGEGARPTGQDWFEVATNRDDRQIDNAAKKWLEMATRTQRRAMQDEKAQFSRATKEADGDYAAFGQASLSVEINLKDNALLYRAWHLRDMAWAETATGVVGMRCRQWEPTYQEMMQYFPKDKLHPEIIQKATMDNGRQAYQCGKLIHIICPADDYDGPYVRKGRPWIEYWIDLQNQWVIIETARITPYYIIPRWQRVTGWRYGTQYACSPAVVCGLPDARVLQAMAYTMLRAGEKAVDPPLVAVEQAVRSDIAVYPGAITYVDADYDERLGDALRPMTIDSRGLAFGNQFISDIRSMLSKGFYADKLTLPPIGPDMTATEVRARVQEYVRNAIALFTPINEDYNQPMCSQTFDLLMAVKAFGSPQAIPDSLQGADIKFSFTNPLVEAKKQIKAQIFVQGKQLIDIGATMDPALSGIADAEVALRDALDGIDFPADWLKDEDQVDSLRQSQQQMDALKQTLTAAAGAGQAAQQVGQGAAALGPVAEALGQ
jgi:hypothetical protein